MPRRHTRGSNVGPHAAQARDSRHEVAVDSVTSRSGASSFVVRAGVIAFIRAMVQIRQASDVLEIVHVHLIVLDLITQRVVRQHRNAQGGKNTCTGSILVS